MAKAQGPIFALSGWVLEEFFPCIYSATSVKITSCFQTFAPYITWKLSNKMDLMSFAYYRCGLRLDKEGGKLKDAENEF